MQPIRIAERAATGYVLFLIGRLIFHRPMAYLAVVVLILLVDCAAGMPLMDAVRGFWAFWVLGLIVVGLGCLVSGMWPAAVCVLIVFGISHFIAHGITVETNAWGRETVTVSDAENVAPDYAPMGYNLTDFVGVTVVLTEHSTMRDAFNANVAVCSVVSDMYYRPENDSWIGVHDGGWSYVGRRRLLISMFAVPHAKDKYTPILQPATFGVFDSHPTPSVQEVAYVLTTPTDVMTAQDEVEWCVVAPNWHQLNAKLPSNIQVDTNTGQIIGHRLTWLDRQPENDPIDTSAYANDNVRNMTAALAYFQAHEN